MTAKYLPLVLAIGLLTSAAAGAADGTSSTSKSGAGKQWGTFVAFGNPYPSLFGFNVAYNPTNDIRVVAGYGEVEVTSSISFTAAGMTEKKIKAETYSVGADYLFRESGLRPLVGARVGYFGVSGDGEIELNGFKKSTWHMYSDLGIDWTADNGFNFGTGLNVGLIGSSGTGFYANVGYFF